jgi:hypothetical protein
MTAHCEELKRKLAEAQLEENRDRTPVSEKRDAEPRLRDGTRWIVKQNDGSRKCF